MECNSRTESASDSASTDSVSDTPQVSKPMDLVKLYQEICTNIRTSDDISFKLLGFVPILSGVGAAILSRPELLRAEGAPRLPIILASLVGATFTFGLFKWELRNVQKCDVLIHTAAVLEQALLNPNHAPLLNPRFGQYSAWKSTLAPPILGMLPETKRHHWLRVGKTQAERIIYWASIAAWLVPIMVVITRQ